MRKIIAGYAALLAADAGLTLVGLAAGGFEGNPLGFVPALAAKVIFLAPMLVLVNVAGNRRLAMIPGLVALLLPVVWNVGQLASLA